MQPPTVCRKRTDRPRGRSASPGKSAGLFTPRCGLGPWLGAQPTPGGRVSNAGEPAEGGHVCPVLGGPTPGLHEDRAPADRGVGQDRPEAPLADEAPAGMSVAVPAGAPRVASVVGVDQPEAAGQAMPAELVEGGDGAARIVEGSPG